MMKYFKIFLLIPVVLFFVLGCSEQDAEEPATQKPERDNLYMADEDTDEDVIKDSIEFDYNYIVDDLESKLSDEFIIKPHLYYVVVSNLSETETDRLINHTITAATECFYNNYFEKRPDEITTIFLFKDEKSYKSWAKELYNDYGLSRFGYYKPSERVMLMNINTGSGTLVHEMTHALVRYDFPEIPAWFNEGLGSLYERCSLQNGKILGYVNWRLPDLQEPIEDGSYTSLKKLLKTNDDEFYGENSGFNYAQARYLCMFLQEKRMLREYYKAFRDNYETDKTGRKTLEELYGKDLLELEKDYLNWVETLEYN